MEREQPEWKLSLWLSTFHDACFAWGKTEIEIVVHMYFTDVAGFTVEVYEWLVGSD